MGKVLIIGAGAVASVAAHKCCQNSDVFDEVVIASRTLSKCDALKKSIEDKNPETKSKITTAQIDANDVDALVKLLEIEKPDVCLHLALPYQDLTIMEACLKTQTPYVDTANFESLDDPYFNYEPQWALHQKFVDRNTMALLGSGFDPGVTGVFVAYAMKHHFDEIETIDILDCNAGDHGYPFATNFNPEINIREVTADGEYWENGDWKKTKPLEVKRVYDFPEIGERDMYLMYHEELESIAKNVPNLKCARFFMTFGESYLRHLFALKDVGMTSIEPIEFQGQKIVPLQFLKAVLPDPSTLGSRTKGKTNIGCIFTGKKDGKSKTYYIYNVCDHESSFREVGSQAVAYTTGVPAMIGASMVMQKIWNRAGVFNVENFDPDPFMEELNRWGLPWKESFNPMLVE
ncbi:MAG: saccharopine dehydrogenase family protein [Selenomonadaceae bacterium]|nr:saccharopine dehydrogenase family protein [Selenomonadaceae bacterium]